jgi:hypothetical protein
MIERDYRTEREAMDVGMDVLRCCMSSQSFIEVKKSLQHAPHDVEAHFAMLFGIRRVLRHEVHRGLSY